MPTVFAEDVNAKTVNQITSDLRAALEKALHEGGVTHSTFLKAWRIVDNWQGAIHQRQDTPRGAKNAKPRQHAA